MRWLSRYCVLEVGLSMYCDTFNSVRCLIRCLHDRTKDCDIYVTIFCEFHLWQTICFYWPDSGKAQHGNMVVECTEARVTERYFSQRKLLVKIRKAKVGLSFFCIIRIIRIVLSCTICYFGFIFSITSRFCSKIYPTYCSERSS